MLIDYELKFTSSKDLVFMCIYVFRSRDKTEIFLGFEPTIFHIFNETLLK